MISKSEYDTKENARQNPCSWRLGDPPEPSARRMNHPACLFCALFTVALCTSLAAATPHALNSSRLHKRSGFLADENLV
ncbi:hypothetical protein CDAR_20041, partial [Caerostris darwini]